MSLLGNDLSGFVCILVPLSGDESVNLLMLLNEMCQLSREGE
jgi:hypothetical protein